MTVAHGRRHTDLQVVRDEELPGSSIRCIGRAWNRESRRTGRDRQSVSRHSCGQKTPRSTGAVGGTGAGQSDHIAGVSGDPLDERGGQPVQGESARNVERLAGGDVGVQFRRAESAKVTSVAATARPTVDGHGLVRRPACAR